MNSSLTPRRRETFILAATIMASGMAFLDGTVVNIAIPTIQNAFQANFDSMLWVVNSFPLMMASLLLLSGSLSDRLAGREFLARASLSLRPRQFSVHFPVPLGSSLFFAPSKELVLR